MAIVKIDDGFSKQDICIAEYLASREKIEWDNFFDHFSYYLTNTVLFKDVDINPVRNRIMNQVKYKYYQEDDKLKPETVNKIFEKYKEEISEIKENLKNFKKNHDFDFLIFPSDNKEEIF